MLILISVNVLIKPTGSQDIPNLILSTLSTMFGSYMLFNFEHVGLDIEGGVSPRVASHTEQVFPWSTYAVKGYTTGP